MQSKRILFKKYLSSEPWWEHKIHLLDMLSSYTLDETIKNGWVDDYAGCIHPKSYRKPAHLLAHTITAYLSAFGVTDGRIDGTGELYSPAATFHAWHKRLGGHGTGAY